MKKYFLLLSLIGILCFSACSPSGSPEESAAEEESAPQLTEDYANALSIQEQLTVGTLNLEETELAVDEEQAKTLLPLWRALQSLENSDTTAAAELTAVVNQIQGSMTSEQIEAIAAMQLTADDIQEAMQNAGPAAFFRGGNGDNADGNTFSGPPDGAVVAFGGPGGGGPGDGGFAGGPGGDFVGGGADLDPDTIATRQATFAEEGGADQLGRFLITPLISLLEVRAGEREAPEPGDGAFFRGGFMGQVIEAITAETGLTAEEIQAQQAEGSSLADIVEANGGDVEAVKAALAESLADLELPEGQSLEDMIDNMLNNSFQPPAQQSKETNE